MTSVKLKQRSILWCCAAKLITVFTIAVSMAGCTRSDTMEPYGYVADRRHVPAHSEMRQVQEGMRCLPTHKILTCVPDHRWKQISTEERWELKIARGERQAWFKVDRETFDSYAVGDAIDLRPGSPR